jgi:hypothetical protein
MFQVSLNDEQVRIAREIGFKRFKFNERFDVASRKIDPSMSDIEISILGAYAEMAVSAAEGLPIRCELATRRTFRHQIHMPDVGTMEVKYTTVRPPRLAVRESDINKPWPAKFVLVAGSPPDLVIMGYIEAEELFLPDNLRSLKHCRSYVAPFLWPYLPPERRTICQSAV